MPQESRLKYWSTWMTNPQVSDHCVQYLQASYQVPGHILNLAHDTCYDQMQEVWSAGTD